MNGTTKTISDTLYALAMLIGGAALIVGAVLVLHATPRGCAGFSCSDAHPYVAVGVAVAVGGLISATVMGALGKLCVDVGAIRAAVEILAGPDEDEPAPNAGDPSTLY